MKTLLSYFLHTEDQETRAKARYAALVAYARKPELYTQYGIPDSLDGRFEAIILQLFIEEERLKKQRLYDIEWIRLLHEAFFEDMDRSLRENGVGDTGIGKRVKRMADALYGRLASYRESFERPNDFMAALKRNVYATCENEVHPSTIQTLADSIHRAIDV